MFTHTTNSIPTFFLAAILLAATSACGPLAGPDTGGPIDTWGDECNSMGDEQCGDADNHDNNSIYRCEDGYWVYYQSCGSQLCTSWGPNDATCQSW